MLEPQAKFPAESVRVSLRDIAFIAFKRRRSILAIVLTALVSATVYLWLIRGDVHEVTAKVLIKIGHEQATLPSIIGQAPMVVSQRTQAVNTELDILQSTDVLARVVDDLGLDRPSAEVAPEQLLPRLRYQLRQGVSRAREWWEEILIRLGLRERLTSRQKAILMLQHGLSVVSQVDSNIIVARLVLPTKKGGAEVLNSLLKAYQEFRLSSSQDSALVPLLAAQVDARLKALRTAEDRLSAFETKSNIVSTGMQRQQLLDKLSAEESALSAERTAYKQALEKVTRLTRELESPEPNFGELGALTENTLPAALADQLATLLRERHRLLVTDLPGSPRVQANLEQSQALLRLLVANLRTAATEQGKSYDTRVRTIETLRAQLADLHSRETELSNLRRGAQVLEEEYVLYKKKLEEASVNSELGQRDIGNVVIVEHAMDAVAPQGPGKVKLLALVLVFSVFAAAAWVSVAEFFDDRLFSASDLERLLAVAVFAVVPMQPLTRPRGRQTSPLRVLLPRRRPRA